MTWNLQGYPLPCQDLQRQFHQCMQVLYQHNHLIHHQPEDQALVLPRTQLWRFHNLYPQDISLRSQDEP